MEPNWGLYNSYYSGDRPPPVSPPQDRMDDGPSHRRMQGTFLPPPPPVTLPGVPASYSSSYHGSSPSTMALESGSSGGPGSAASMHMTPTMPYSGHMSMSQQVGYHYPVQQSTATMSTLPPSRSGPPHGYSPRVPGGYPTASPTMNPLSPLSPSTHISGYPAPSSGGTSASSFPSSVPPPHSRVDLPSIAEHRKRRTASDSGGSWDERKDDDEQPWGMPQEQYKALNPRDKKQVRNRIGARRFRAKRKDYVSQLEASKKESDQRIVQLEGQLETSWREINDLRSRLNMPPLPPPETGTITTLGLVVGSGSGGGD